VEYLETGTLQTLQGSLSAWPGASNSPSGAVNTWTTGNGNSRRDWRLETTLTTEVTAGTPPVFTQNDFPVLLSVNHATPQPVLDYQGAIGATTNEVIFLEPQRASHPTDIHVERVMALTNGVEIRTSFFWPNEPPTAAGYTAPLVRFDVTRITGLTSEAIVLTNYYSQTYRPGHHNFTEEFIFEPRLEPGVSAATLAELQALNILFLHATWGEVTPRIHALGFDQKLRKL
jgi:hypothetical protein